MELNLPLELVSKHDVLRTIRELETIEDFFTQGQIRKDQSALPKLSPLLAAICRDNKVEITDEAQRRHIGDALIAIRDHAPVIHISFAVEPSAQVIQKVILWFRREVNAAALVHVGIQPSIAAGCVVRTTNMYFDFSLRQHLLRNGQLLLDKLRSLV